MRTALPQRQWFLRGTLASGFVIVYLFGLLFQSATAHAEAIPGGNIKDPVVRAVDIAKPAVVRIVTSIDGRLTVDFTATRRVTFPQSGGAYQLAYSGSGAFISSHGDILTAAHVINSPPEAELNDYLYQEAAQDVADYINNNLNPTTPWTAENAYVALSINEFPSRAQYGQPQSKVYLSTDYTGPLNATRLQDVPDHAALPVDKVKKQSPFDQKDVAIIHVMMDDTPSIQLGDASSVAQQDELTIIGFPGNGDVSDKKDPTMMLTSSVNKLYVSALKKTDAGAPVIQVGGNIEHGDSGGPALNANGQIVGVVSFGVDNAQPPEGTAFLQSGESAQELVDQLGLDVKPGKFQQLWSKAFSNYASTASGHWHKAQQDFKQLQTAYPNFKAVEPYLTYVNKQASKEPEEAPASTNTTNSTLLIVIVVVGVAGLFIVALVVLRGSQRRQKNAAIVYTPGASPFSPPAPGQATPQQPYTPALGAMQYNNVNTPLPQAGPDAIPVTPTPLPGQYERQQQQAVGQSPSSSSSWQAAPAQQAPGQDQVQPAPWSSSPALPSAPAWGTGQTELAPPGKQPPAAPVSASPYATGAAWTPTPTQTTTDQNNTDDSRLPWPPAPAAPIGQQQAATWRPAPSTPPDPPRVPATAWQRDEENQVHPLSLSGEQAVRGYTPPARPRPQEEPAAQPPLPPWQNGTPVPTPSYKASTLGNGQARLAAVSEQTPASAQSDEQKFKQATEDPNERTMIRTSPVSNQSPYQWGSGGYGDSPQGGKAGNEGDERK